MKRTLFAMLMALSMLLTACGSAPAASTKPSDSTSADSAVSSGSTADAKETVNLDEIPEYELLNYSIGLLDNGFFEGVTALDHVVLPKLEGMTIPAVIHTVEEADVDSQIASILSEYAGSEQIRDRAVQNGDLVNIDYVGRINGVAFDGGSTQGMGTTVTAGSTAYIDDFLTQIIGAMPGDTVMVEVTFPVPYQNNPDLEGKDAVFETVINYIEGDYVYPELTDAFVKENLESSYRCTTTAELRETIEKQLRYDQTTVYVLDTLAAQSTINNMPEKLVEDQCAFMLSELKNIASYNNMPLGSVLTYYGYTTMEDMYEAYRPEFRAYAEQYLLCQAVAEKVGLEADDEAVKTYFEEMTGASNPDAYIGYYGRGYVAQDVLMYLAVSYVLDNAVYQ